MTVSVEDVKTLLRIQGSQDDSYLEAVIPLAEEYVKSYCNQDFIDPETGEPKYPGSVKLAIAKLCQLYMKDSGVQSESLARHSVTYSNTPPPDVMALLRVHRRPKFV